MHPLLSEKKSQFDSVVERFQSELGSLRTGRATPTLVEDVKVMAYDSVMDVKSVASIMVQDAKTLVIEPWDKSLIQAIEKGIRDAQLGFSPAVEVGIVRIVLPPMTEENRKQLVKHMKEKLEEARVRLRGVREEAREAVMKLEKEAGMGEDEKYKILDEIDKTTKEYVAKVEAIAEKKEREIMTV